MRRFVLGHLCSPVRNRLAQTHHSRHKSRSFTIQQRELDLLCRINHENVVKLIDKDEQVKVEKLKIGQKLSFIYEFLLSFLKLSRLETNKFTYYYLFLRRVRTDTH